MKLVCTQLATDQNQYGYTDYEMEVVRAPGLIVEMVLTIPFDDPASPYITFISGDEDRREDKAVSLSITKPQADALLAKYSEPVVQ
jgi:hypothetical protein